MSLSLMYCKSSFCVLLALNILIILCYLIVRLGLGGWPM